MGVRLVLELGLRSLRGEVDEVSAGACAVPVLSHWSKPLEPEGGQGFAPVFAEHLGRDQVAGVHAQRRTAV